MKVIVPKLKPFKAVRRVVTVEPMLFLYFLTYIISTYVGSNMMLHKGCDPTATVAPDLKISPQCLMEKSAQHDVSTISAWKYLIQELLSVIFIVFAGPWSDNHGRRRRPLMFVPVFGQILCDALNILFAVYWQISPTITGIVESVIVSTTGSTNCFFIGMFAYLSDVTDETNRTMRMGFAAAIIPLTATIGALTAGYLNINFGFTVVFGLNIAINVLALCLGCLFIYDTSKPYKSSSSLYKSTFNPNIIINSFKSLFVKRDNNKRRILLLMVVASPLAGAPFIVRLQRNWVQFFKAYTMVVMLLGSVFTLIFLSRILKINDAMIGLVATFFDIATCVGFLLATQYKYLLFVPPFELFRGVALSLSGSIASKCVESHELASMNSMRMVTDSLSKSSILPLYNIVYNYTLESMPSAYFIISLCLTIPLIGCFAMTYYFTRNQVTPNLQNEGNSVENKSNAINSNSTEDIKLTNIEDNLKIS